MVTNDDISGEMATARLSRKKAESPIRKYHGEKKNNLNAEQDMEIHFKNEQGWVKPPPAYQANVDVHRK